MHTWNVEEYNVFTPDGIANLIFNVNIYAIFLVIFYFTYAVQVENQILDIQINDIIGDITTDIKDVITDQQAATLRNILDNITLPDLSSDDIVVEKSNANILKYSIIAISVFTALCILSIILMHYFYKIDISHNIVKNFVILFFIAITEILFLNFVSKSYKSLDPNVVKKLIIQKIQSMGSGDFNTPVLITTGYM